MIRVLQVAEAMEGGVCRHVCDLVSALDPRAFACELAVSFARDPAARDAVAAVCRPRGLAVRELPLCRRVSPAADAAGLLALARCVRESRPDVVHAHSAKAGFLARAAGAAGGVPVVYTPHAFPFLMRCGGMRRRFYRWLERLMAPRTAALIAVSEEEAREAARLGYAPERVSLIHNGVARRDCGPVRVRETGPLRVGFFGRLAPQKGADLLVRAAAATLRRVPDARFVLTGGGSGAAALRRLAARLGVEGRVELEGPCAPEEVTARMRQVDVVAVPSRWEGCPYVVLEAFQAGVPVVAAPVGGVPDLVRDGVDGVWADPRDEEAFGGALAALLADPGRRRRLAEAGRAAAGRFRLERMAAETAAVYGRARERQ